MLLRFFSFTPASAMLAMLAPASEHSSSELSELSACRVLFMCFCSLQLGKTGLLVADLAFERSLPVGGLKLDE
jgi:hypothetical protein